MLRASGLVLRPPEPSDVERLRANREQPETARWVNALQADEASALIAGAEESRLAGSSLHLVIADEAAGRAVGEIALFRRTPEVAESDAGEIAYVVVAAERGRGIATTAVALLTDWAFAALGLARIQLSIHPENVASRRVAEKAGYTLEGTLRSVKVIRGSRVDVCLYSRLPSD
jgi:RimJ/RimL family protein N-acetyltransferase